MIRNAVINFLAENACAGKQTVDPDQKSDTLSEKNVNTARSENVSLRALAEDKFPCLEELADTLELIIRASACRETVVISGSDESLYLAFGRCRGLHKDTMIFRSLFEPQVNIFGYTPGVLIAADPAKLTLRAEIYADSDADEIRVFRREKLTDDSCLKYGDNLEPEEFFLNGDLTQVPGYREFARRIGYITGVINSSGRTLKKAVTARRAVFSTGGIRRFSAGALKNFISRLVRERVLKVRDESYLYLGFADACRQETDMSGAGKEHSATDGPELFVSFTPEKLFSIRDGRIYCDALAGSVPVEQGDALIRDPKNLNENRIVADFIDDRLRTISDDVQRMPVKLKRLSYITHLLIEISGNIKNNISTEEIIRLLHPTPATLGYPREEAVRVLDGCGALLTGMYAGTAGMTYGGCSTALVMLRSALFRNGEITLYGGAGIMGDSDPLSEWKETGLKMTAVLKRIIPEDDVARVLAKINMMKSGE